MASQQIKTINIWVPPSTELPKLGHGKSPLVSYINQNQSYFREKLWEKCYTFWRKTTLLRECKNCHYYPLILHLPFLGFQIIKAKHTVYSIYLFFYLRITLNGYLINDQFSIAITKYMFFTYTVTQALHSLTVFTLLNSTGRT